jgi:hypothetical protein
MGVSKKIVGFIGDNQADNVGTATGQTASRQVRPKVQLGNGLFHPLPGGFNHAGLIIDYPGNGLVGYTGLGSDIFDGSPLLCCGHLNLSCEVNVNVHIVSQKKTVVKR